MTNLCHFLLSELWENAYSNKSFGDQDFLMLEIFHTKFYVEDHHSILSEFKKTTVLFQLICDILATDCLALGVHFPDVRFVIHWGTPKSLVIIFNKLVEENAMVRRLLLF